MAVHSSLCGDGMVDAYLEARHLTEFPKPEDEPVFKMGTETVTGSQYLLNPPPP